MNDPMAVLHARDHFDRETDLTIRCIMLIWFKMYSAITHGSHVITWSRHVAGISEFVSAYCHDSINFRVPRYLLQQVQSAQVSSLATRLRTELLTDHVKAHTCAL
jgi:hypothetical protein